MSLPKLYTIEEAAEYLDYSPWTLKDMVTDGKVPHTRIHGNRGVRFTEEHLIEIVKRGERRPTSRPGRRRNTL